MQSHGADQGALSLAVYGQNYIECACAHRWMHSIGKGGRSLVSCNSVGKEETEGQLEVGV